jgi:adenosine kinase
MKKEQDRNLVVSGSTANDHLQKTGESYYSHFKNLPEKFTKSVLVDTLNLHRGGTGANIAYTFALLGEHPLLLTAVGSEDREYIERLRQLGVRTERVHFSKTAHTARYTGTVDTDGNTVASFYSGAMLESETLSLVFLEGQTPFVILSPHHPAMMHQQIHESERFGYRLCFDPGQQVSNGSTEMLRDGVRACEVLILNDHELGMVAERLETTPEAIRAQVPLVITTLGAEGSRIDGRDVTPLLIPVAKPHEVVDPTGAGDAYRAGFFTGYLRGFDLETAGKMGAVAAAYAVEHDGGQEHSFTPMEFVKRYRENFGETIEL